MLTTVGSSDSAILANELDNSTGDGGASGLASGATGEFLAARAPCVSSDPIKTPIPKVTSVTTAGRYLCPFLLIPISPLSPNRPSPGAFFHYSITMAVKFPSVLRKGVALKRPVASSYVTSEAGRERAKAGNEFQSRRNGVWKSDIKPI